MDNEKIMVPYIVHEGAMARAERHIKRLVIAIIVLVIVILMNNIVWLYVWNSYEYVGEAEITVDGEGNANYIGNDMNGDINNGKSNSPSDAIP